MSSGHLTNKWGKIQDGGSSSSFFYLVAVYPLVKKRENNLTHFEGVGVEVMDLLPTFNCLNWHLYLYIEASIHFNLWVQAQISTMIY